MTQHLIFALIVGGLMAAIGIAGDRADSARAECRAKGGEAVRSVGAGHICVKEIK